MSWPTAIWSMVAAACLTMALPHLIIGIRQRGAYVHLFFAMAGFAVAWMAAAELSVMRAVTTQESGRAIQIAQVPMLIIVVAIVGFVHLYFGTGRLWLGVLACGLRAVCLVVNFADPPNLNFREVTALRTYQFLGETVSMPLGPRNPWLLLAYVSSLLVLAFVIDATRKLWRQRTAEGRRRAVVVGGAIVVFIIVAQTMAVLINAGAISFPYSVCIPFMGIVTAMAFELGYDVVRAAQLSRSLRETEERMNMAAESAQLSMWEWDIARDEVWMTDEGRTMLGFGPETRIDFASMVNRVHPDDRAARAAAIQSAVETGGSYEMEYRLLLPDGSIRWLAARGRCASGSNGSKNRLLGISMDITARKQSEQELHERRGELAHLSRVNMLGELSGSLAHELNQPLTAILSNAQAAENYLAEGAPDLAQVREILADIVAEDERAGEVIRRLRLLLKKGEVQLQPLDANELVNEVLKLARSDLANQGVTVETALAPNLAAIRGDGVQLQQVLLNLVMNACDAMANNETKDRRLTLRTSSAGADGARIEVSDAGHGLPGGGAGRAFERYFTTKPHGLGLGLSVCHTIITAHGGTLGAANNPERGATFYCTLPLAKEPRA